MDKNDLIKTPGMIPRPSLRFNKRYVWLTEMIHKNKYKVGAEIGCDKGATTSYILYRNSFIRLYAVDMWGMVPKELGGSDEYDKKDFMVQYETFKSITRPFKNRLIELRGVSWEMAAKVADNTLDFVFIDADHIYPSVKKDILAWTPKLRAGGMMSGHDINLPGVLQAVTELIPNYKDTKVDHCWVAKKEDVHVD